MFFLRFTQALGTRRPCTPLCVCVHGGRVQGSKPTYTAVLYVGITTDQHFSPEPPVTHHCYFFAWIWLAPECNLLG